MALVSEVKIEWDPCILVLYFSSLCDRGKKNAQTSWTSFFVKITIVILILSTRCWLQAETSRSPDLCGVRLLLISQAFGTEFSWRAHARGWFSVFLMRRILSLMHWNTRMDTRQTKKLRVDKCFTVQWWSYCRASSQWRPQAKHNTSVCHLKPLLFLLLEST